jgi:hypothetical protein
MLTPRKETLPSEASTKPEFTGLSEDEVRRAVQDVNDHLKTYFSEHQADSLRSFSRR